MACGGGDQQMAEDPTFKMPEMAKQAKEAV
jgi:hypothetical protein